MVFQIPPHGVRNPVGPRFRGEWHQWGEILKYTDFSDPDDFVEGLATAEYLTNAPDPTTWLRPLYMSASANRPDLSGASYIYTAHTTNTGSTQSQIILDIHPEHLGLPDGYSITKVTFYAEFSGTSNLRAYTHVDRVESAENLASSSTRWYPNLLTLTSPALSYEDPFGLVINRSGGTGVSTFSLGITGITVWGVPEGDRYILGDTVSYQGELWRNIVTGNNDEPGTSVRWQKVSHNILPPDLRSLNDVDLVGLYDRANLTYWAEDQKWHPGDKTEDQRNFRGDWQDPADTLLWASDFSNPADRDFFVESSSGTIQSLVVNVVLTEGSFSTENNPSEFYQNQLRYRHGVAGSASGSTELTFDLGQVLPDRYVSRISFWSAARRFTANSSYSVDYDYGGGAWTTGVGAEALREWEENVYEVSRFNPALKWRTVDTHISSGTTGETLEWNLTGFKVYGAASNDDLYRLSDVTYHDGSYWRSLFPLNADEPSEESEKWEKIGDIFAPKTLALGAMTDVDLAGKYEGAILKYDEDQQVWRPGQYAPDYRNFRGDWQDPADTLLWSTDFSDPADINTLVPQAPATVTLTATQGSETDRPESTHSAWCSLVQGGISRVVTFDLTALGDAYVSRIEWLGSSYTSHSSTGDGVALYLNTANLSWAHVTASGWTPWAQQEIAVEAILPDVGVRLYVGGNYGNRTTHHMLTDLRVYGALDNEDLYRLNDVVAHNGYFWRSLFNLNAEEPSEESEKWVRITEFVVDGHAQPQGAGRVDVNTGGSPGVGTVSVWTNYLAIQDDFWLSGVRNYTGGVGPYEIQIRDLAGKILTKASHDDFGTTTSTPEWFNIFFDTPYKLNKGDYVIIAFIPETPSTFYRSDVSNNSSELWISQAQRFDAIYHWEGGTSNNRVTTFGLIEYGDPTP